MSDVLFNENGYKKYIVFFLFLIFIFIILIYFVFFRSSNKYMIINESSIITKTALGYKQIKNFDNRLLRKKYNVYSDGDLYENVSIKRDSYMWYYFNDNYEDLELNKVSFAYTNNFKGVSAADYDVSYYSDEDDEIIKSIIGEKDVSDYKDTVIKSSFDLDNDGTDEIIYTMNDLNVSDNEGLALIFIVKNGKVFKKLGSDSKDAFLVQNIIDIDGNGKYEIFVSKGTNDVVTFDTCMQIYSMNKRILNC